jgi:hypothetical protein
MTDTDLRKLITTLRRHVTGLTREIDELETQIVIKPADVQAPGATAAGEAATREYRIVGPQEVKTDSEILNGNGRNIPRCIMNGPAAKDVIK